MEWRRWLGLLTLSTLAWSTLVAGGASAQGVAGVPGEAASTAAAIEELREAIRVRDDVIRNLIRRLEALESDARASAAPREPAVTGESEPQLAMTEGREAAAVEPLPQESESALVEEMRAENERLVRQAFESALVESGGLLLPAFSFEYSPNFSYIHSQTDRVVVDGFSILPILVIGEIVLERIRRNSIGFNNTFRVGLPFDSQLEARLPLSYEGRRVVTADEDLFLLSDLGIGDVEVALSKTLFIARGPWPSLLASARWKSTTGSNPFTTDPEKGIALGAGYHSLDATLTSVKVSDPLALFGSLSYTVNFPTDIASGKLNPGDRIGASLGLGLALNLQTSLNFGFQLSHTDSLRLDGRKLVGTSITTSTFSTGISYNPGGRMALDFSVGMGLTEDSPDVVVSLTAPIRFSWDDVTHWVRRAGQEEAQ